MRDFLLTDKAFAPPPITEFSERDLNRFLRTIYGRHIKPCYLMEAESYPFQMELLIEKLVRDYQNSGGDSYEMDANAELIADNFKNMHYPSGTLEERKRYFAEAKHYIEQILYLIKDRSDKTKQKIIFELSQDIAACGPGAYNQLALKVYELKSQQTITFWLANLRKNKLHLLADEHIAKKAISDPYSHHVHIGFSKISEAYHWGIPCANKIAVLPDDHETKAQINKEDEQKLKFKFERYCSRAAVIETTVVNAYALLRGYQDKNLRASDLEIQLKLLLKPFLNHGIFDLNILEYDEKSQRTSIGSQFWELLPLYCERLLEAESIILGKEASEAHRASALRAFSEVFDCQEAVTTKQEQLHALIQNGEMLGYYLFWLSDSVALQLLTALEQKQLKQYFSDPCELLSLLYQLPLERGRALLSRLGNDELKSMFSSTGVFLLEVLDDEKHPLASQLAGYLSSQQRALFYVDRHILTILVAERARLYKKYPSSYCPRATVLDNTIREINALMIDKAPGEGLNVTQKFKERLEAIIRGNIINNQLDKYPCWGPKLGLVLLNTLVSLPAFTLAIKRVATGSWFFSLRGKSYEAAEKALQEVKSMTI